MKYSYLIALVLGLMTATTQADVTFYRHGKTPTALSSEQPVRLNQALAALNPSAQTYWLAATFGLVSGQAVIQQKQQAVLSRLNALALSWQEQPHQSALVQAFAQQLASWTLVDKSFYSVELDRVRLSALTNPMMNEEAVFYFPPRPTNVQVIALSHPTVVLPHQASRPIATYIEKANPKAFPKVAQAYVIQPDGVVEQANIGYWLRPSSQLAPGATIFVGIADLPDEFANLNEQIADLLRYQLYWWD